MVRVVRHALAAAALLGSAFVQAAVVNQVQANFGVVSPLPYSRHFGTTFQQAANGGYTTVASSAGTVTYGQIDGSVLNAPLVSLPGSANFNFYDDHLFTMPGTDGTLTASAISVSFGNVLGIDHLQARLYEVPAAGLSTGPVIGASYAWLTVQPLSGGVLNATFFEPPVSLMSGKQYALEVRGLVHGPTASYGGNVNIAAVPESDALGLALAGLGVTVWLARRRRA